jgi:CxxC motif-containing protein (DUF1111 family)
MKPMRLRNVFGAFLLCCFGAAQMASLLHAQAFVPLVATEAPAGFDRQTNGHTTQAEFVELEGIFARKQAIADGVGPVYNAVSCADCHANPVIGGNSQVFELRAGHLSGATFVDHPGGSLVHSRAIDAAIQERVLDGNEVRALRASPSVLGLGFVEAIADDTLRGIAAAQPSQSLGLIHGQAIAVPIAEHPGHSRVGRFGVKQQQASLLSFAGDEYLNQIGITTPLFPIENTSNGKSIAAFDDVPGPNKPNDPDDGDNDDLEAFALFMRSTKAPPRDAALAATPAAQAGSRTFTQIGCAICHVASMTTAPPGTVLNANVFAQTQEAETNVVSAALGNKTIHPYSDFLLHDIATGDGIVQGGGPSTRNKFRTIPLWGLRTRSRYMHDGLSFTLNEAILRHGGEATLVSLNYRFLSTTERNSLLTFLRSL